MKRSERKAHGLCYVCGREAVSGKTLCRECSAKQSQRSARYYSENSDSISERGKRYEAENKEKLRLSRRQRYYFRKDNGLCVKCSRSAEDGKTLCRECAGKSKDLHKNYSKTHKEEKRAAHIRRKFGIDIERYNEMAKEQDGKCAICGKHQDELLKNLHVDHDHATGEIRGLLCQKCNLVIGLMGDSVELLDSMKNYLMKFGRGEDAVLR